MSSDRDSQREPALHAPHDDPVLSWDPIDVHIGDRIRSRRMVLAMTQEQLAGALRVSREQIGQLESGGQPIPSAGLWDLAKILEVPIEYFFQED